MDSLRAGAGNGLRVGGNASSVRQHCCADGILFSACGVGLADAHAVSPREVNHMKTAIIVVAASLQCAGPVAAECVTSPVVDVYPAVGAGKDQKLHSLHTGGGWSHIIVSMPGWMRAQRAARRGYDIIDLWGIPRSGTYSVSTRYTNSQKSVVCDSKLRFK